MDRVAVAGGEGDGRCAGGIWKEEVHFVK
jgi:hypothetical protein